MKIYAGGRRKHKAVSKFTDEMGEIIKIAINMFEKLNNMKMNLTERS